MDSERMGVIIEGAAFTFNQLFGIVPHGFIVPRVHAFDAMCYMAGVGVRYRVTGKTQPLSGTYFFSAAIPDDQIIVALRIKRKPCFHFVRFRFNDQNEIELLTQLVDGYRIPPSKKVPAGIQQIKMLSGK